MDESVDTRVVSMFIKLTNAARQGDSIYVNLDHVSCIFQEAKADGGSLSTYVHSRQGQTITWEVEESPSEIMKIIEEANAKRQGCSCK